MKTASVGEPDYRLNGDRWEEYALRRLRDKHVFDGPTEFVSVPAAHKGDLGIDAFTRSGGIVYQCYAAEDYANAKDLYEHQLKKVTEDLAKLFDPSKASEIQELIGPDAVITRWILVVPQHRSRLLIQHCNKKAKEFASGPHRPTFIARDLVAHVWTEADLDAHCPGDILPDDAHLLAELQSPWSLAVYESELWPEKALPSERLAAARVANLCWAWALGQPENDLVNPWRDDTFPVRAAKNLATLGRAIGGTRSEEAALLLVAPCLRQALLACAERQAWTSIAPLQLDPQLEADDPLRRQYDSLLAQRPQLKRRAHKLLGNGHQGEWVVWWLLHQALLRSVEIWRSRSGILPANFVEELEAAAEEFPRFESVDQLIELARAVAVEPDDMLGRRDHLREVIPQNKSSAVRFGLLSALLAIGGRLSFDPLLMPEVLVDHVGLSVPITPEITLAHVQTARWISTDDDATLVLDATCEHAAIDKAMADEVTRLERYRQQCLLAHNSNPKGLAPVKDIPVFSADNLRPKNSGRTDVAYVRPHVSFAISQDEVRELLMGERLYGDPALAIRELYQNALDACRYRQVRLQYQTLVEDGDPEKLNWKGKIKFVQGQDASRGAYIECYDNGVGMRHEDLLHCFAKAGRRFADSEEYLDERARWQARGLNHYPNSQFGIGVFSYFMLADEIEITTRRFGADCRLAEDTLNVTISGAGSLFHIRKSDKSLRGGGTIVRLYLNREHHTDAQGKRHPISVLDTLRSKLWVAEYDTSADEHGTMEVWEPGELKVQIDAPAGHRKPAPAVIPVTDDVWWVEEELHAGTNSFNGRLLVDGVVTDERIPTAIFNLKGRNKPQLTVDRRRVLTWPQAVLTKHLNELGGKSLLKSPFSNYASLLFAAQYYPVAIQKFLDSLTEPLQLKCTTLYGSASYDVATVGVFPPDIDLDRLRLGDAGREFAEAWNSTLVRWPRRLLAYRLGLLTKSGSWPRPVLEWVWRNKVEHQGPPLGPVHSVPQPGAYGPSHSLPFADPSATSYTFGKSAEEVARILELPMSFGMKVKPEPLLQKKTEQIVKNFYSAASIKDPAIDWNLVGENVTLSTLDLELLANEESFPCARLSPWRVFAIRAAAKTSPDQLLARLRAWEKRGVAVEWGELALDKDLSPEDQKLFAPPFSLTPGPKGAVHSLLVRLASEVMPRDPDQAKRALDRTKELGLAIPALAGNILGTFDELDRSIVGLTRGQMPIIGHMILKRIAAGELDIDAARLRIAKYDAAGFAVQVDLSEIRDQEDASAAMDLFQQFIFTNFSLIKCLDNGVPFDRLDRVLKWGSRNGIHWIPKLNLREIRNIHLDDIDRSILTRLQIYDEEINHDTIACFIVKNAIGKEHLKERLEKYRTFGLNVGEVSDFSETYAFLEAERQSADRDERPSTVNS
jgi:hypothetical protein